MHTVLSFYDNLQILKFKAKGLQTLSFINPILEKSGNMNPHLQLYLQNESVLQKLIP
jgi:hypothetical protein